MVFWHISGAKQHLFALKKPRDVIVKKKYETLLLNYRPSSKISTNGEKKIIFLITLHGRNAYLNSIISVPKVMGYTAIVTIIDTFFTQIYENKNRNIFRSSKYPEVYLI